MQGVTVDTTTLALDAIDEFGPGGHHFGSAHTTERYRPLISDWQNYGNWLEHGALTAADRAYWKWNEVLANYRQPPLDPAIAEELRAYVERRHKEILPGR
jgi:trimethylamine--corrinoid protein Co-methyltransferase